MTVEEANTKVLIIADKLQQAQLMLMELKGHKTSKLKQYPQGNIDLLIQNINDDFIVPAINSIIGEF